MLEFTVQYSNERRGVREAWLAWDDGRRRVANEEEQQLIREIDAVTAERIRMEQDLRKEIATLQARLNKALSDTTVLNKTLDDLRRTRKQVLATAIHWTDSGAVWALDQDGKPIDELQGSFDDMYQKIMKAATDETVFRRGQVSAFLSGTPTDVVARAEW